MTDDERDPDNEPPPETDEDTEADADGEADEQDEVPARQPNVLIVRIGCIALTLLGILSLFVTLRSISDPASTRCTLARSLIEDANDDDEEFNNVDTDGVEPGDIECNNAIRLAEQIRQDEDDDDTVSVASERAVRTQGAILAIIGLGQAVGGFLTFRTFDRRARIAALVFAALGILLPLFGILSLVVIAFAVYALTFSGASRAIWAGGRGFTLFRPRPRPTE